MNSLYFLAAGILCVFAIWCLLLIPRRDHPGWEAVAAVRYAHRGLHDSKKPENSLPAFRAAAERGLGAELDLHLLKDGKLAVFHDGNLRRMCGADVTIEELTGEQLQAYTLLDSGEHIPLFEEVLEVFAGGALVVELKATGHNTAALVEAAVAALQDWNGVWCMESFHPGVIHYLKKHHPEVIRGQLTQNYRKGSEVGLLPGWQAFVMTHQLTTTLTRPDFIACRWEDRNVPALRLMRRLYRMHEVSWTVRDKAVLERLEREGCVPIFENFTP